MQTHYITVASSSNNELAYLQHTAEKVSGVRLKVLGLGLEYNHYGNKIHWTYEHVVNRMKAPPSDAEHMHPDDVIVFMDAYDVLLFPSVRNLAGKLHASPTPIVFCSEHGLYPEYASGWLYNRPTRHDSTGFEEEFSDRRQRAKAEAEKHRAHYAYHSLDAKQLNSGCYLGRAEDVRDMLHLLHTQADFYRDDQQMIVRHAQSNPQLVSIDHRKDYFRTAYRQFYDATHVAMALDFNLMSLVLDVSRDALLQNDDVVRQLTAFLRHNACYGGGTAWRQAPDSPCALKATGRRAQEGHSLNAVSLLHCNNKGSNSLYAT